MTSPKRRGRPPGSVSLTADIQAAIVSAILAGCFDHVAAQNAGIDSRTFRDWMSRGEGRHPTKSCTPKLKAFAKAVRIAQSQARAAKEIDIAKRDPKWWLAHVGRSRPGREGWTEPLYPDGSEPPEPVPIDRTFTDEDVVEIANILAEAGVFAAPDCTVPDCTCTCHPRRNKT
jgi:hypothetical protein